MSLAIKRWIGLLVILVLAGCGTAETRYLTLIPRPPAVEAQSYNLHDPFPDEDAGPYTGTRPRQFMNPYSDTRKDLDLRFLKAAYGLPQQRYAWDSPPPATAAQYPVQPVWRSQPASAPPIAAAPWQQP